MNKGKDSYFSPKNGIWAFLGNYGSGKTEVAVNYSISGVKNDLSPVSIIDLDIINPYFRSREVEDILETYNINLISPKGDLKYADLPIITPNVKSSIKDHEGLLVLDIGGEDSGANVLKPFKPFLLKDDTFICMVINLKRPFTGDIKGILDTKKRIEDKIEFEIGYFINNTNLIDQTESEMIIKSHEIVREASGKANVSFLFTAVNEEFAPMVLETIPKPELFLLKRFMLPPWYSNIQRLGPLKDRRAHIK